jgi:carbonic anhydrase
MADKIISGIVKFREKDYLEHKDLFSSLKTKQKPHTLFIGCSDSRVLPNLITNTLPGELFVIRNIANLVPPYRITNEFVATTSAIEYAVCMLNVENIIVCGHSNCGGCAAMFYDDEKFKNIPNVKNWLTLAQNVKDKLIKEFGNSDMCRLEWVVEQTNVVEQLTHLMTYPYIKDRVDNGKIKLYGLYYIIETGEIYNYNFENGYFEVVS